MFENILVPLDTSDRNRAAIDTAAELARLKGGRVRLLHVVETLEGAPDEETKDFYRSLEARAAEMLDGVARDLAERRVTADAEVTFGKRAQEIVRFSQEHGVDLIVMSSRPFDPEKGSPKPWPTISHKVAVLSPCPVLLVRG